MLRSFRGIAPRVAPTAYVDASAQVIGDVDLGERSSVWMNAVVRADSHYVRIGHETNIQDGSVLHPMRGGWYPALAPGGFPVILGDRVTVGHSVTLHGCVVEDDCLIGMGAVVLNGAHIGTGSIIAAGAVVTEGTLIPPRSLFTGVPAVFRRHLGESALTFIRRHAASYVDYAAQYRAEGGGSR